MIPSAATFKDQGLPELNIEFWYGFLAPVGTAPAVVDKLNVEIAAVLKDPEIVNRYKPQGVDILHGTPQEFATLIAREAGEWPAIVIKANVKID